MLNAPPLRHCRRLLLSEHRTTARAPVVGLPKYREAKGQPDKQHVGSRNIARTSRRDDTRAGITMTPDTIGNLGRPSLRDRSDLVARRLRSGAGCCVKSDIWALGCRKNVVGRPFGLPCTIPPAPRNVGEIGRAHV